MTHIKNYFTNYTAVSVLVIGLFFATITAFKPGDTERQVLMLEFYQSGTLKKDMGVYIFLEGKMIEHIHDEFLGYTSNEIVKYGESRSNILNKYSKQGWRITSTIHEMHNYHYILEK